MLRSFARSGTKNTCPIEVLRDMKIDDIDGVIEIEEVSFPTPWTRGMFLDEINEPLCSNRIAVIDGIIMGYSCFALVYDEVHLRNIAVRESFRRKGVASRLLGDMIAIAVGEGAFFATLEVRRSSIHAQRLYERFGFQQAGVRPKYYSDTKEDALIMWADLRNRWNTMKVE